MHMWHHVTNHLITSNDKDSNSENRIKLRVRDNDEPIQDNPPSKKIRLDLEDIQGIVAHKLEELRCGNNPDSVVPKFVWEDALEYLQDRTGLLAAREHLVALIGGKKLDLILRGRVQAVADDSSLRQAKD
jgi:hypothetical protein